MKINILYTALASLLMMSCASRIEHEVIQNTLRPPAYPLITIDPYTSGWATTDKLYEGDIKHWTGKEFPLIGVLKVDGQLYRFMGVESIDLTPIAKTGLQGEWKGRYTTKKPSNDWTNLEFDDSSWKLDYAPWGTTQNEPTAKTHWGEEFIWVRRIVNLEEDLKNKVVYIEYTHDDDTILYVNGIEVVNTGNTCRKNAKVKLSAEVTNTLKKGENIISGYCHNRVANGLFDFGLSTEKEAQKYFPQAAEQKSVDVQSTQTHYKFACGPIDLNLTFTAPLLMDDLDLMARPINYISYTVESTDNQPHDIEIYFEASPRWALDQPLQESQSEILEDDNLVFLKTGSKSQDILAKSGDDLRIDWGYFYMVADKVNADYGLNESSALRTNFTTNEKLTSGTVKDGYEQLGLVQKLGKVSDASGKVMLGYDDQYSIQYFGENIRPYWNRENNETIINQFKKADKEYSSLIDRCYQFDKKNMEAAIVAGGKDYAELCAIAYRQSVSAHKLIQTPNGDLAFLSKENFSNGSIGTVDITYPSAPIFLYYNPELVKGLMNHIFYYSESGKWTKPFAAHDIGTYPLANGQTYGGDMPIEESGNMIILAAALAKVEGNAKYAEKHWEVLTTWTNYLLDHGLDPANQLCTDDFAGHFAHNANLSIKAILGVASYGRLADMLGKKDIAKKHINAAKDMATEWEKIANDGDHYKLTFDKSGTWSQKYNLVWNKILNMNIFPDSIADIEIKYYLTKQNKFGLPLDSREAYTKTDWIIWTATLAQDKGTFEEFVKPVRKFMNESVERVPMSDWVFTDRPNMRGFQARSVVGGYYIKMLDEKLNK